MTTELSTDGEPSFYNFDSSLGVGKSITSPPSHVGTSPQSLVAARSSDSDRLTLTIALLTFPSIASRISFRRPERCLPTRSDDGFDRRLDRALHRADRTDGTRHRAGL